MRLSRFESSYLSDALYDCDDCSEAAFQSRGRRHRDGVLRGLLFIICLGLPFGLTFGFDAAHRFGAALPLVAPGLSR